MVHFQHHAVRQLIAAAELGDERLADHFLLQLGESSLSISRSISSRASPLPDLKPEDILRLAAGQGFLPDADRRPDADIALPHGKFFF